MSANLARIRNWNRGQLAERISALEQQNAELVAMVDKTAEMQGHQGDKVPNLQGIIPVGTKPYAAPPEPAPQQKVIGIRGEIDLPHDLHEETKWLVVQFAEAMAQKLAAAERKYGYEDGWRSPDWMDECRAKLIEHLAKGDPRDVANYCAFLWYHHQPTVKISSTLRTDQWSECFSKRVCVVRGTALALHTAQLKAEVAKLMEERTELKSMWDYYQQLIQDHSANGIGALIVQRDELANALNSALEIVTTDRCDGDSAFASGVNAACERHAIGIRSIIEGVKK